MKPVQQTRYGKPQGNCLMASVASILEIPLDDCPDLYDAEQRGENYWDALKAFLKPRGYLPVWMTPEYLGGVVPRGYAAVAGNGGRGAEHVCVALNGRIVHDPLPDGAGLLSVSGYVVLVPAIDAPSEASR